MHIHMYLNHYIVKCTKDNKQLVFLAEKKFSSFPLQILFEIFVRWQGAVVCGAPFYYYDYTLLEWVMLLWSDSHLWLFGLECEQPEGAPALKYSNPSLCPTFWRNFQTLKKIVKCLYFSFSFTILINNTFQQQIILFWKYFSWNYLFLLMISNHLELAIPLNLTKNSWNSLLFCCCIHLDGVVVVVIVML